MKIEQTECSETSAYKIHIPGNYPEESIKKIYVCIPCSFLVINVCNQERLYAHPVYCGFWLCGLSFFQKQGIFETTAIIRLNRSVLQNVLIFWSIWYCTGCRNQVIRFVLYHCRNTMQLCAYSSWWRRQQWHWYSSFLPFPLPPSSLFPRTIYLNNHSATPVILLNIIMSSAVSLMFLW
jgi:hypothetical protein